MRAILVPVADRPECANALRTAFDIGQQLGANLCGCHIRTHRHADVSLPEDLGTLADYDAEWEKVWKGKKAQKSGAAAKALFGEVAKRHDYPVIKKPMAAPGAFWLEKIGSPDKVLSNMGPVSDLIIVSRPAAKGGKLARLFLQAALMNTARPVMILPQSKKPSIGRRISIAWNQSPAAAQAATAAIPLLRHAEKVNIIISGAETGVGPKSTQLATYLRSWGIKSQRVKARGEGDAKALLEAFQDTESDLLVMGAYSRSRLRQRVFGGVTEFMLHRANIPVVMLHT